MLHRVLCLRLAGDSRPDADAAARGNNENGDSVGLNAKAGSAGLNAKRPLRGRLQTLLAGTARQYWGLLIELDTFGFEHPLHGRT